RDRALAGILREERHAHALAIELGIGAELSGEITAAGHLDLDDVGSHVRELVTQNAPASTLVRSSTRKAASGRIAAIECAWSQTAAWRVTGRVNGLCGRALRARRRSTATARRQRWHRSARVKSRRR